MRPSAKDLLDYPFFSTVDDDEADAGSETTSPAPDILTDHSHSPSADPLLLFPQKETSGEALDVFFVPTEASF
jgi:hypothetical protein